MERERRGARRREGSGEAIIVIKGGYEHGRRRRVGKRKERKNKERMKERKRRNEIDIYKERQNELKKHETN